MTKKSIPPTPAPVPSRRDFLAGTAATVAAGTVAISQLSQVPFVHAAGGDAIRVGLIGCGSPRGGRGRGAAENCVGAGPNVQLYAMADLFRDNLDFTKNHLTKKLGDKINVSEERCFSGWDAYERLLKIKEIDLVILATPPGFRPLHLRAAVDAGKHIFCEKPVATDATGIRKVLGAVEDAKKKNLSIVSGLCYRYDPGMRPTYQRVLDGDIGDIVSLQCTYNTGELWSVPRTEAMSDVEWQIRNWLYFTWVSGDHNVEQHVHSLDKMAWVMKDVPPVRCYGVGGRQKRTGKEFGHIFDHHSVVYEYANGVKLFAQCRQQDGCSGDVSDHVFGTRGICHSYGMETCDITGDNAWKFTREDRRKAPSMYDVEHQELIAGIRAGKPINNGDYMTKSSMMAIMGRMATYTGKVVTWDFAMNKSKEDLMPSKLDFGPMPVPAVAVPGVTQLM